MKVSDVSGWISHLEVKRVYIKNPIQESELALDLLYNDTQWKDHWYYFLEQMVYDENKPSFDKAYAQLQTLSHQIFEALR